MKKVKVFRVTALDSLERGINEFLATPNVRYVDLKFAVTFVGHTQSYKSYDAILIYEED